MILKNILSYFCLLFFSLSLSIFFFLNSFDFKVSKKTKIYPSETIKHFSLGYENTFAGSMWLNFLTDSFVCDQNPNLKPSYNSGGSLSAILNNKLDSSRCNLSWGFQILNLISDLNPSFFQVYLKGGMVLSVVIDDREGAKIIFDKGLRLFPNNSELNFRAAYHYLFEIQDADRAIKLLTKAYQTGGPSFIPGLIGALYQEQGQLLLAKATLEEFLKSDPPEDSIERVKKRLEDINLSISRGAPQ